MVVQRALGIEDVNVAMPAPDRHDAKSQILGVCKRLAVRLPHVSSAIDVEMDKFIDKFFGLFFRPLRDDDILDPMEWIETRPYTQARKQEHKDAWLAGEPTNPQNTFMWIKSEWYDTYKHDRFICPLDDWTKMYMGPVATEIDKQVFRLPCFIKKVPQHKRVEYLIQLIDRVCNWSSESDVTSMEAHHRHKRARWLVKLVTKFVSGLKIGAGYIEMVKRIIGYKRRTVSEAGNFRVYGLKRLCSGMNETSVFNSLLCVMLHFFILEHKFGHKLENMAKLLDDERLEELEYVTNLGPAFVASEGDDKLSVEEPAEHMSAQVYAEYGFAAKPRKNVDMYGTDFCSMIFTRDHILITDVLYVYVTFGWANDAYLFVGDRRIDELIRARAMSLFCQYENCPVLHELARYAIRITSHVDMDRFFKKRNWGISQYEFDQLYEAYLYYNERIKTRPFVEIDCPVNTRLMVERMFGVSVDEQKEAERKLMAMTTKQQLNLFPLHLYPEDWLHYSTFFVREESMDSLKAKTNLPPAEYAHNHLLTPGFWNDHGRQFRIRGQPAVITDFNQQ